LPLSILPGAALGHIPQVAADSNVAALLIAASAILLFPIIMLSQLDISSPAGVLAPRIVSSLAQCPLSWLLFYLEISALAAICGGTTIYLAIYNPNVLLFFIPPLYVLSLILFARLLGRLAWQLGEKMAIEAD
jgi:hypothetical protein